MDTYKTPETEWEYGCVRCQKWHGESDGPIYKEHIWDQSKHGTRRRPVGGWHKPAARMGDGCNDAAGTEVAQVRKEET